MLQDIFKALLVTSFIGTALTLILILIKPITKKWFTSSWHYYMWLIVLIVMILPIRISIPEQTQPTPVLEAGSQKITDERISNATYEPFQVVEQDLQLNSEREYNTYSNLENLKILAHDKLNIISFVWFIGMLALFLCKLIGYIIFLLKLHKYSDVISCPDIMRFTNKKIVTRTSDRISSPLMIGLFKPTLLLPKTAMTPEQLDNVLAHEMMHFKRKDILYKWFVSIVRCIHWFNPAIYCINKQINIECEISCDLAVVKEMSEEQEVCYINTILTLLAAGNLRTEALTTGMTSDKKTLKIRFTMIKKKAKISKKAMVISIILSLVILCSAVLASGLLNGKFINGYKNELFAVNTDISKIPSDKTEPNYPISDLLSDIKLLDKLKANIKSRTISAILTTDGTGIIFYDVDSGEIVFANSKPRLTEELPQPKVVTNATETNSEINTSVGTSESSYTTRNIPTPSNAGTKIKSTVASDEPYTGFEHLVLQNADTNKIKQELNKQGIIEAKNTSIDLNKNYAIRDYGFEETKVVPDANGNISMYFSVDSDNLFDVLFYDAETGEDVGSYGVLANNENAYTFIGFEKGKVYNVEVQGKTKGDWTIEGNYIIYLEKCKTQK